MSSHRLYLHVVGWIVYLALYSVVYFVGVVFWDEMKWTKALANLIPVSLALPAVGLAAAFQRRNSYLQALRDLWGRLVPAAQVAIQYTHLNDPGQSDFARTQFVLSSAIDELRSVFANVPAEGAPYGLYPYENLKDIRNAIAWLNFGPNFSQQKACLTRKCIVRLWQEMHEAMLREFDRDVPAEAISKYRHWNTSLADLLENGTLSEEDFALGRSASNPVRRPPA